jgi:hypothetical protein
MLNLYLNGNTSILVFLIVFFSYIMTQLKNSLSRFVNFAQLTLFLNTQI